jgi:hypothetical protein
MAFSICGISIYVGLYDEVSDFCVYLVRGVLGGVWDCSFSRFSAPLYVFLAKQV